MLVDKILVRFAICLFVPEICAIKVESCQKSGRNLEDFSPSQILAGGPLKTYTHFITLPRGTSPGKSFVKILPLARKL